MNSIKKKPVSIIFAVIFIFALLPVLLLAGCGEKSKSAKKQIDPEEVLNQVELENISGINPA